MTSLVPGILVGALSLWIAESLASLPYYILVGLIKQYCMHAWDPLGCWDNVGLHFRVLWKGILVEDDNLMPRRSNRSVASAR